MPATAMATATTTTTLILNGSYMNQEDMLDAIRAQAKQPSLASISLRTLGLDQAIGQALLFLLHLHRHRSYDTLELVDCAQTPYLAELLRYVYHTQLFRHLSMKATASSPADYQSEYHYYMDYLPPLQQQQHQQQRHQQQYLQHQQQHHPMLIFTAPPTARFHFALRTLTLSGSYVSIRNAVWLRKSLEATKQLTTLNLDCVQFERCAICQIAQGIESNTTLQTMYGHWISSVDAYVMMHSVQSHPTLTDIHFRGDCISDSASVFLGKGLNQPDICPLQTLRLTGLGVFDLAPMLSEIQQGIDKPSRLVKLDLSDNLLQNYQVDYLFLQLYKLPALKELNLSRNQLSDFCGAILSNPNVLSTSLTTLDMTYNRLTDHGVDDFLTHLWKFPALRDLDFSRNQLHNLDFPNFLGYPQQEDDHPLYTYNLRRLSLFHPHFSLLDPGEAVSYYGWNSPRQVGGDASFSPRFLHLLKRLPYRVKIGSFWACHTIETQYLLDIRQVSITPPDDDDGGGAGDPGSAVPDGLWPHMLAQANQLFCNDESRQANAIFYLVQQGAPFFVSASSSSLLPSSSSSLSSSSSCGSSRLGCRSQNDKAENTNNHESWSSTTSAETLNYIIKKEYNEEGKEEVVMAPKEGINETRKNNIDNDNNSNNNNNSDNSSVEDYIRMTRNSKQQRRQRQQQQEDLQQQQQQQEPSSEFMTVSMQESETTTAEQSQETTFSNASMNVQVRRRRRGGSRGRGTAATGGERGGGGRGRAQYKKRLFQIFRRSKGSTPPPSSSGISTSMTTPLPIPINQEISS